MNSFLLTTKRFFLRVLSVYLTARGFTGSQARKWIRFVLKDYRTKNGISFLAKWKAHQYGFMSPAAKHFHVTKENASSFISLKDYMFLYPINDKYSKWISDKLSSYYIFKPFRKYFPKHYYHLYTRDGNLTLIPLHDSCTGDRLQDLFQLIQTEKKVEWLTTKKKSIQTISYQKKKYYLNDLIISEMELEELFRRFRKHSIIRGIPSYSCEFIQPTTGTPLTLRLIITNVSGDAPEISDAYLVLQDNQDGAFDWIAMDEEEENENAETGGEMESVDVIRICSDVHVADGSYKGCAGIVNDRYIEYDALPGLTSKFEGRISCWDDIQLFVGKLCRFVPQIEFLGLEIHITNDGFVVNRFLNQPPYPIIRPFSETVTSYLKEKVTQKEQAYNSISARFMRGGKKIKLRVRSRFAKIIYPKGLIPYLSVTWIRDVLIDFFTNRDEPLHRKIWAYQHGYLSYRLKQYGITKDNRFSFISDFEYKWLRHINTSYRNWLEDKITVKYIVPDHNDCFPGYYYFTSTKNGANKIIPMMDCPEYFGNSFEDVFRLLESKKVLALKPVEGSHGQGFYRLSLIEGAYYLNTDQVSKEQVLEILQNPKNQYLITEYIQMHQQFKDIYDGAVNTIRMVVFKKDGKTPQLGNAYMRFGSLKTGAVDNMGAGGMFARIDIETGRYYDAKIIEHNSIQSCPYHPDTNVLIDGIIPHWDKVIELVLQVAKGIPQLEYFGFDLAVTEDGIKFPEINRFPDYPKIETLSPLTIDYLLYKLDAKKKLYGYDMHRPFRLINLPKR